MKIDQSRTAPIEIPSSRHSRFLGTKCKSPPQAGRLISYGMYMVGTPECPKNPYYFNFPSMHTRDNCSWVGLRYVLHKEFLLFPWCWFWP